MICHQALSICVLFGCKRVRKENLCVLVQLMIYVSGRMYHRDVDVGSKFTRLETRAKESNNIASVVVENQNAK